MCQGFDFQVWCRMRGLQSSIGHLAGRPVVDISIRHVLLDHFIESKLMPLNVLCSRRAGVQ